MTDTAPAPIGHNKPPEPIGVTDDLNERYKDMAARFVALTAKCGEVPENISDDATAGSAAEVQKAIRTLKAAADQARKIEKEPWAQKAAEVDAWFKNKVAALEVLQGKLLAKIDKFSTLKAAREKAAREEAARVAREEARLLAEQAAEAERKKKAAEEEAARAAAAAEAARVERLRQEQLAAKAKRRAERIQAITPYLQKRAQRKADLIARAEAEAAAKAAADEAKRKADQEAKDALAAAAAAKKMAATEQKAVTAAGKDQRKATTEAKVADAQAGKMDKRADRMDRSAQASGADLARTRGDYGALITRTKRWECEVEDFDALRVQAARLFPFIAEDAIRAAVTKAMQAGDRGLPGVRYEQVEEAVVR